MAAARSSAPTAAPTSAGSAFASSGRRSGCTVRTGATTAPPLAGPRPTPPVARAAVPWPCTRTLARAIACPQRDRPPPSPRSARRGRPRQPVLAATAGRRRAAHAPRWRDPASVWRARPPDVAVRARAAGRRRAPRLAAARRARLLRRE
eukprot:4496767-Prymnesium_polylepis.2